MITRRDTLVLLSAAAATAAAGISPAFAQNVSPAELLKPGPLGDAWLGPEDAKVTIVEYASLTCTHCATFHKTTWPELKKRYVDTGQARFTLREFPLDRFATIGFMLARSEPAKYYPITDFLFEQQANWAFTPNPLDAMRQLMRQAGFSAEKFDSVTKDQALLTAVNAVRTRGADVFKVESTPTFFINGQRKPGALSLDEIEKVIKPILGA